MPHFVPQEFRMTQYFLISPRVATMPSCGEPLTATRKDRYKILRFFSTPGMEESAFYCANHRVSWRISATLRVENPKVFPLENLMPLLYFVVVPESLILLLEEGFRPPEVGGVWKRGCIQFLHLPLNNAIWSWACIQFCPGRKKRAWLACFSIPLTRSRKIGKWPETLHSSHFPLFLL